MPSPKLEQIKKMLETGQSFSLTNADYKRKTGLALPKDNYYLTHKSALAKCCKQKGYKIVIQERTITLEKEEMSNE